MCRFLGKITPFIKDALDVIFGIVRTVLDAALKLVREERIRALPLEKEKEKGKGEGVKRKVGPT